jgi:hypothetical protein
MEACQKVRPYDLAVALKLIGAGVGRTGTHSLKLALEELLGGPCYHMSELFGRDDDIAVWHAAARGEPADLNAMLEGYEATVDWPAAAFWHELAAANPDAVVLLSLRSSPEAWWASFERTIATQLQTPVPEDEVRWNERRALTMDMMANRFTPDFANREAAIAAYGRNTDEVRRAIPAGRLVEWQPGDGWGPLCAALGVPEPAEPFPHTNTSEDFRSSMGLTERE